MKPKSKAGNRNGLLGLIGIASLLIHPASFGQNENQSLETIIRQQAERIQKLEEKLAELENNISLNSQNVSHVSTGIQELRETKVSSSNVDSNFKIKLYGFVKFDAIYNSDTTNSALLPAYAKAGGSTEGTHFTARQTRLGATISNVTDSGLSVIGKVETDFYGTDAKGAGVLRIRRAFVDTQLDENWSLLLGQEWDTGVLNVIPKTLNFNYMGGAGWPWNRHVQARITRDIELSSTSSMIAQFALAEPSTAGVDVPTAQWNLNWTGKMGKRKVSLGTRGYYGESVYQNSTVDDNLFAVTGKAELTDTISIQGKVYTGKGLMSVKSLTSPTGSYTGGFTQVTWNSTDKLDLHAAYGFETASSNGVATGAPNANQLVSVGLFYKFRNPVLLGVEYSHFDTEIKGASDVSNDRLQTSAIFKF